MKLRRDNRWNEVKNERIGELVELIAESLSNLVGRLLNISGGIDD